MSHKTTIFKQLAILSPLYLGYFSPIYANQNDLLELSVEDLMNVEVISVAKKAKSLNDSPAAIFVISQDDIRRMGATSIPEALRLAPGVDVARIDSSKWAVSARGFNGRFANKLLVMIDGRNTYTRAFAGVYWENQGVMLEDVERIEVVRGPGATLWGANAVNGVINIITKHSANTQGGLLATGGGTEEQGFGALRYGTRLNEDTTARVYVKGHNRDENSKQSAGAGDEWTKVQGGFRMDSQLSLKDSLTVQGDAYSSDINQNSTFPMISPPYQKSVDENIDSFGGNLLMRHQHTFSSTSDYSLQASYDFYERDAIFAKESRHTIDIDFQHRFGLLEWNDVVWGLGYRYNHDDFIPNNNMSSVDPLNRNDQLFSAFVQDEITIVDDSLWLTLGSKFEHNDYSGFEVQPTARLMWKPHQLHRLWGAVSRSVRTPSRLEHDMDMLQQVIPPQSVEFPAIAIKLTGNENFDSEKVMSYEVGYRTTFIKDVSIDFTAFYNDYHSVRSAEVNDPVNKGSYVELPVSLHNNYSAETYGFEIAAVWQMLDWWRWDAHYRLLKTEYSELSYIDLLGLTSSAVNQLGMSPQQSVSLRSAMSPLQNIDIDLLFRYIDKNVAFSAFGTAFIKDYVSMDIRLAWRPVNSVELSLVGQNLLADQHLEYRQEFFVQNTSIDRGVYGKLVWQF